MTRNAHNKALTKTEFRQKLRKDKHIRIAVRTLLCVSVLGALTFGAYKVKAKYEPFIKTNVQDGYIIASQLGKSQFLSKKPTVILNSDNKPIKALTTLATSNSYTKLKDINPLIKKGLIDVEDKRFYEHHGVDPYGTMRALANFKSGATQGGSTITQQLVKNVVLKDQRQTLERKLKEMVVAQELEKKYSKDQILEFYLNNISYSHSNLGVQGAAKYYFNTDQKHLTISQAAMLIGLINNPVSYDPVVNHNLAVQKRDQILSKWYKDKLINKSQYERAKADKLKLQITPTQVDSSVSNNYALSYALNSAVNAMMHTLGFKDQYLFKTDQERSDYQKRYAQSYALARESLLNGGYEIHTDIDQTKQDELQKIVNSTIGTGIGLNPLEASVTVINNDNGQVAGIIGGANSADGKINRGYLGYHQPGSTAKMLVAYPEAFERGYLPQSRILDGPITNGPKNWYAGYRGYMPIRYAVAQSVNTVAFKLASQTKPSVYLNKLAQMQFDNLAPEDANPIIAIGGFTYGVTTTQMAAGYSTLTRQGNFIPPTSVTEITQGKATVYKNEMPKTKVFTENASYASLDVMKSVMQGNGSGAKGRLSNYPYVAGKTGTTDNNTDSYFVGMTPHYTIAVWVGHDHSGISLSDSQLELSKAIFKKVGEYYNQGLPKVDFQKPSTVIKSGDNLYFTKKADTKKENTLQEQVDKRAADNKQRLTDLAYRLQYHLTLKQELARENKVQAYLDKISKTATQKEIEAGQYYLDKAQNANQLVRRTKQKEALANQIAQKSYELKKAQATYEANQELAKQSEITEALQKKQVELQAKSASKIAKLKAQFEKQKQALISAYQNNGDIAGKKQALLQTMQELATLGVDVSPVNIQVLQN